jgi:hypothetical protein
LVTKAVAWEFEPADILDHEAIAEQRLDDVVTERITWNGTRRQRAEQLSTSLTVRSDVRRLSRADTSRSDCGVWW